MTLTASKIELAMKCKGAFTLPHLNERNAFSDAGNERHEEREAEVNAGDIPERIAARWPGFAWRAEVAFMYDVATGEARELGAGIKRAYGELGPFEVAGTADLVGRGLLGELVVIDHKSFEEQARAAEHPQLRFLALAAARAYEVDIVDVAISPEVGPLDVATLEAFDLDEAAYQIRQVMLDVAKAQNDARNGLPVAFSAGRQCRWCPAFHACPKQSELSVLVRTDAMANRIEATMPFRDDETAADAYEMRNRLRILLKRLEGGLFARANEKPIPLGNGKMFGPVDSLGNEKLDGDVVHAVVSAQHGRDIADAAIEKRASKKRLKEALAFAVGKGGVSAAERAVLDEVRAKGGSERLMTITIEEYPDLRLLAGGAK